MSLKLGMNLSPFSMGMLSPDAVGDGDIEHANGYVMDADWNQHLDLNTPSGFNFTNGASINLWG